VCIWDTRKLRSAKSAVARLSHGASVNCAYFNPSGTRLVSTCMDNLQRVWSSSPSSSAAGEWDWKEAGHSLVRVKHNNHTGRWVTPFRAVWIADDAFVMGNMERR
jgi:WD repeat-containing protein 76